MNAALPDVSLTGLASAPGPLTWVGMQDIDLPVTVAEPGYRRALHARADAQVDLPAPQLKGIHMSRLYRLLDTLGDDDQTLSPQHLRSLLQAMIDSHQDCGSRNARVRLHFELMTRRAALVTQGLSGWKAYPVRIDASLCQGVFALRAQVTVTYSSTCPCSAALARQLIGQGFLDTFPGQPQVESSAVVAWLHQHATLATPHSQRSQARVAVAVPEPAPALGLLRLIEYVEQAVGTPVQTAVKRADEQAFAALNGSNLMFVEDAARRIQAALQAGDYRQPHVHVRHLESLHPHDAVAWATPAQADARA